MDPLKIDVSYSQWQLQLLYRRDAGQKAVCQLGPANTEIAPKWRYRQGWPSDLDVEYMVYGYIAIDIDSDPQCQVKEKHTDI